MCFTNASNNFERELASFPLSFAVSLFPLDSCFLVTCLNNYSMSPQAHHSPVTMHVCLFSLCTKIAYLHAPAVFPLALWFQHFQLALQFECFPPQRFFILLPFLTLHHCSSPHTCHVSTCTLISMFPNCTSIWIFSTSMILCLVTLCHCSLPYTLYSTCTSISTFPTCTSI